ncbi:MAG: helix-turn-helix transcriptional regulator [Sphaerochaeta sp.]|nr:helix-turn-helix transcriptional regulator [Sphaerochaeta sp.]
MITMIGFWERFETQIKVLSLTKKEVAALVGISYGTFVNYSTNNRIPKTEEAVRIAKAIGTSVEYLVSGEEFDMEQEEPITQIRAPNGRMFIPHDNEEPTLLVPIAPQRVSAGYGQEFLPTSEYVGYVRILERMARGINPASLIAVSVKGDSMTGVQIFEGDMVIFAQNHISENGIYVISLYGDLKVKRLEFRSGEQRIFIHSENSRYSTEEIPMNNDNLVIMGKVVGWVHCHPY